MKHSLSRLLLSRSWPGVWSRLQLGALLVCATIAVPASRCAEPALQLNLKEAIALALRSELQPRIENAKVQTELAAASLTQVRSALATQLDAGISDSVVRFDLRALGIDFPQVSPFVSNVTLPDVVGPFSLFDARITGRRILFDRGATGQTAAAASRLKTAQADERSVQEQIAVQTARAYYTAVLSEHQVAAATRGVADAGFLLRFEEERKQKGLVSGAEVRRAALQVAAAEQKLVAARSDRSAAHLELKSVLGIDFARELELTQVLEFSPRRLSVETALEAALQSRPDLRNYELQVRTLQLTEQAIDAQKLPTLAAFGNVGSISTAPTPSRSEFGSISYSYSAGLAVRLPILDGGRRAGQIAEVEARRHGAEVANRQLRRQVELGVRLAVEKLHAAEEQVMLATKQNGLADEDVAQARALVASGDASGVDLSDALARQARVQAQYTSAVYQHILARLALGEVTGTVLSLNW